MKGIMLDMIREAGFEIFENTFDCVITAPIDFSTVKNGTLYELSSYGYYLDENRSDVLGDNATSSFTIYKDGEPINDEEYTLDEVIEFFEDYFSKNRPYKENKNLTVPDILIREKITIEEVKVNLRSYSDIDLDSVGDTFSEGEYLTRNSEYVDDSHTAKYNIYCDKNLLFDGLSANEVQNYIDKVVKKYKE